MLRYQWSVFYIVQLNIKILNVMKSAQIKYLKNNKTHSFLLEDKFSLYLHISAFGGCRKIGPQVLALPREKQVWPQKELAFPKHRLWHVLFHMLIPFSIHTTVPKSYYSHLRQEQKRGSEKEVTFYRLLMPNGERLKWKDKNRRDHTEQKWEQKNQWSFGRWISRGIHYMTKTMSNSRTNKLEDLPCQRSSRCYLHPNNIPITSQLTPASTCHPLGARAALSSGSAGGLASPWEYPSTNDSQE